MACCVLQLLVCDRLRPAVVFLRPAVLFSLTRRMTSEPKKPHSRQTAPELLLIAPYWSPLVSVLADVNTELPPSLAGRLRSRCNQAVHVCARGYQTAELGGCVTSPNSCSVSRPIPVTKPTCSHSVSASASADSLQIIEEILMLKLTPSFPVCVYV